MSYDSKTNNIQIFGSQEVVGERGKSSGEPYLNGQKVVVKKFVLMPQRVEESQKYIGTTKISETPHVVYLYSDEQKVLSEIRGYIGNSQVTLKRI